MKIYVIDTCRVDLWRAAFPTAEFVHELNMMPTLVADDIVFAHTHDNRIGRGTDFCLAGFTEPYPSSDLIGMFCDSLLAAAKLDQAPFVFMYSGANLNEARIERWRGCAVGAMGPLPGFPAERIIPLNSGIARNIATQLFSEIITEALATLPQSKTQSSLETPLSNMPSLADVSGSRSSISSVASKGAISIGTKLKKKEEALLALRLLCEAKKLRSMQSMTAVEGVAIRAPKDLKEWLDPFKTDKTQSTPAAEDVAGLMGNAKKSAEALFKAVKEDNGIDIAIDEFLKVSTPQPTKV